MALIHCPECHYELSSKAKNCPNCGYPISSKDVINASVGKQEQRFHDNKKIIIYKDDNSKYIDNSCIFRIYDATS